MAASVLALLAVGLAVGCAGSHGPTSGVEAAHVQDAAVYPLAGTPDASAQSEISFRGVAPDQLTGVKVVGSKSKVHAGAIKAHSDGEGASFVPAKPFAAGERVSVSADVPLVGQRNGAVSFTIARSPGAFKYQTFADGSKPVVKGSTTFHSRPDLHPPIVKVTKPMAGTPSRYFFMAPKSGPGQDGPLIFDNKGQIVWFHALRPGFKSYDFRTATYGGKPVVTWWQGRSAGEYGGGTGIIADSSYRVIATVKGANGYPPDLHEFLVTPQGTALVVAYRAVRANLKPIGPRSGALLDSIAMEIDIKTGRVLFEWHSLGHIPVRDSYSVYKARSPLDFTHLNSVAIDDDGNFLISARNTWTVYKVDRRTGKIIWRLGGKRSTFKLPSYAHITAQHDFTREGDGSYTVFDNANMFTPPKWISRALDYSIDEKAHRARLLHAFRQPQGRGSTTQGSVQQLANGHYVVGWGDAIPGLSEFTAGGKLVFDARLLTKVQSYRAYSLPWSAEPNRPPDVAVVKKKGKRTVYASWNGATDVAQWEILAGSTADSVSAVAHAPRRGFETGIPLPGPAKFVAARAVSASGATLARSKVVRVR